MIKTTEETYVGADVESDCWWECKLVQPLWKWVWQFLRKSGINLPQNPALPLLGIYLKDAQLYQKDTFLTMLIAFILLPEAGNNLMPLNQRNDNENVVCLHNYYSAIKKNDDIMESVGKWI